MARVIADFKKARAELYKEARRRHELGWLKKVPGGYAFVFKTAAEMRARIKNPYSKRASFLHKELAKPSRFSKIRTKRLPGGKELRVGRLKGSRKWGVVSVLTPKRRNPSPNVHLIGKNIVIHWENSTARFPASELYTGADRRNLRITSWARRMGDFVGVKIDAIEYDDDEKALRIHGDKGPWLHTFKHPVWVEKVILGAPSVMFLRSAVDIWKED